MNLLVDVPLDMLTTFRAGYTFEDRLQRFKTIWDETPYQMASAMYQCLGGFVSFESIFADKDGERKKWRKFTKACFLWLCEKHYIRRIVPSTSGNIFNPALT